MATTWTWAAAGKHPVAGDYIRIGSDDVVLPVFARWMEDGYERAVAAGQTPGQPWSWRFWSRGPKREELVCGLIKSSSDRIGRVYPLLVLGSGPVRRWHRRWPLLAAALETTWNRVEAAVVRLAGDIDRLSRELHRVPPPRDDWSRLESGPESVGDAARQLRSWDGKRPLEDGPGGLYRLLEGTMVVKLPRVAASRQAVLINGLHRDLARLVGQVPHVVFIGGTAQRCSIVVFTKRLHRDDFRLLLDLGVETEGFPEKDPVTGDRL